MPKRKKKRKPEVKRIKKKTRCYPVAFCLKENKVIGFSLSHIPLKADKSGRVALKRKVNVSDWKGKVTKWLTDSHEIDMTQYKDGDMIFCSNCKQAVDFRIFPSNEVPTMINNKMENESKP